MWSQRQCWLCHQNSLLFCKQKTPHLAMHFWYGLPPLPNGEHEWPFKICHFAVAWCPCPFQNNCYSLFKQIHTLWRLVLQQSSKALIHVPCRDLAMDLICGCTILSQLMSQVVDRLPKDLKSVQVKQKEGRSSVLLRVPNDEGLSSQQILELLAFVFVCINQGMRAEGLGFLCKAGFSWTMGSLGLPEGGPQFSSSLPSLNHLTLVHLVMRNTWEGCIG